MQRQSKMKIGYCYNSSDAEVPAIKLTGHYLRKFGFDVGDEAYVIVTRDRIVIEKSTDIQPAPQASKVSGKEVMSS